MSSLKQEEPIGVLDQDWYSVVGEYAIAGGWTRSGDFLVVGDAAGGVYAFDGTSGESAWTRRGMHEGGVLAVSVHPNEPRFATAGPDGRALIWNAHDGQVIKAVDVGSGWVENVAWSPSGQWLAVSCSKRAIAYSLDGTEVWRSDDHPSTISAIAWSNSEELATACYGQVAFFDMSSGKVSQELQWKGSLVSMVLSPDGDVVACGSQDRSVHFWRRSTGRDSMMSGYPSKPSALAFNADGTLLATGGGEAVTVWSFRADGPEGTRPRALDLHAQPVTTLDFGRHSTVLASGGRDGAVIVWSLEEGEESAPTGAAALADAVAELYWRPDGRALAALDAHGGVTVWRVRT